MVYVLTKVFEQELDGRRVYHQRQYHNPGRVEEYLAANRLLVQFSALCHEECQGESDSTAKSAPSHDDGIAPRQTITYSRQYGAEQSYDKGPVSRSNMIINMYQK